MECEVLCTGTFNLVHAGHCQLLQFAARYGLVTVGVNNDAYLVRKYGEYAVPLGNRALCLRSNRFVNRVVVFQEDEPSKLIRQLRPRFYVRGPDYTGVNLVEQEALDEVGAKLVIYQGDKIGDSSKLVQAAGQNLFKPLPGLLLPDEAIIEFKQVK